MKALRLNPAQLLIGSTLDTWYPAAGSDVLRRDSTAIINALSAASVPLSAIVLHTVHRCASDIRICNQALRSLVRDEKIVRVRTIRPYTYAMPESQEDE